MAIEPLPCIKQEDFPEFQRRITDLPDEYENWLKSHNEDKSELERKGHTVKEICISTSELEDYLSENKKQTGTKYDLRRCACDKWRRQQEQSQKDVGAYDTHEGSE